MAIELEEGDHVLIADGTRERGRRFAVIFVAGEGELVEGLGATCGGRDLRAAAGRAAVCLRCRGGDCCGGETAEDPADSVLWGRACWRRHVSSIWRLRYARISRSQR